MPRPKPHYRVVLRDLQTRDQLMAELFDLPFATTRTFRLRVNGKWASKMPAGSKTRVLEQLRRWWVSHEWMEERRPGNRSRALSLGNGRFHVNPRFWKVPAQFAF